MLTVKRNNSEVIELRRGTEVIRIMQVDRHRGRIGVEADQSWRILRSELWDAIDREAELAGERKESA